MKKFFGEFKDFIAKGNVIDLAVGVIIGGAFGGIVTSLVENIITPVISLITKGIAFADLYIPLAKTLPDGTAIPENLTLAAAQEAGLATLNYGLFIQGVINFLITAFVIFLIVKFINKLRTMSEKKEEVVEAAPTTKVCPFCKSEIALDATRCPHCTSEVE